MALHAGLLVFPGVTQLDLTGPLEVFWRISEVQVHLLWKSRSPVVADGGLVLMPTCALDQCPALDVVFVPGGPGTLALMEDGEVLDFLRAQAAVARYVTSVCTGALVLGAAGLLHGYRAATHWLSRDLLPAFGATVSDERYVVDRNRITGGGVTAGLDFALALTAMLRGEDEARRIQLQIEYNPAPPFDAGSPETAGAEVVRAVRDRAARRMAERRAVVARVTGAIP